MELRPFLALVFALTSSLATVRGLSCQAPRSTQDAQDKSQLPVTVWDDVLAEATCRVLHDSATATGLGHRVFRRPPKGLHRSFMERALDEILTQLGDKEEKYVEYWTRQEWRHIEAHADVDENLAKEQDKTGERGYRYPEHGHVLYLKVGTNVCGPTCLFPNRTSGGELNQGDVELVTVPAVPGRLLRFEGSMLHTVPRPTDLWLLPFVKGTPEFSPEDAWGRSVILFNTWPISEAPPKDVALTDESCESQHGAFQRDMICHSYSNWTQQSIIGFNEKDESPDSGSTHFAKIWLLGNTRRRNQLHRTVKLSAPSYLRDMLSEGLRPQFAVLNQPQ